MGVMTRKSPLERDGEQIVGVLMTVRISWRRFRLCFMSARILKDSVVLLRLIPQGLVDVLSPQVVEEM